MKTSYIAIICLLVFAIIFCYIFCSNTAIHNYTTVNKCTFTCQDKDLPSDMPAPKVALLISGQLRDFHKCYPSLKQFILDPLQPDIFLFTDGNIPEEKKDLALSLYQPVSYHWCSRKLLKGEKGKIAPGLEMMFYCIEQCNELKKKQEQEQGFRYDIVIRIRPDLYLKDYIPASVLLCIMNAADNDTCLYFPVPCSTCQAIHSYHGIQDQIAVGNSTNMDVYGSIHTYIDTEYNSLLDCKEMTCLLPELLLKFYLINQGIQIEEFVMMWFIYEFRLEFTNLHAVCKKFIAKWNYYPWQSYFGIKPPLCKNIIQ